MKARAMFKLSQNCKYNNFSYSMTFSKSLKAKKLENKRKHKLRSIWLCIGSSFLLLFGYIAFGLFHIHSPDVKFESSDGKWSDSEMQFKGRTYKSVIASFNNYKKQCNAPATKIFRVSKFNFYNIFAWPNYFFDEKWKVKYHSPSKGADYSGIPSCEIVTTKITGDAT